MPPVAIAIVAAIFPAAATTFVLGVSIATIIGSIIGSLALSALAVALSSKSGRRDAGIRVNSTITGGTAAQFFPVGVTATKGAFAYPKLTHGGKGGTQFLTHVIVLGHKPHIRINRVALEGEWADIDWTRGAGSTASTPTETPSDTGGLPTPTRPRAASPTLLITTATNVTGGAFCTFQYDDNSSFSSPSAVYDTAKNNSHAALWTLPAGTTYVRARLTRVSVTRVPSRRGRQRLPIHAAQRPTLILFTLNQSPARIRPLAAHLRRSTPPQAGPEIAL